MKAHKQALSLASGGKAQESDEISDFGEDNSAFEADTVSHLNEKENIDEPSSNTWRRDSKVTFDT